MKIEDRLQNPPMSCLRGPRISTSQGAALLTNQDEALPAYQDEAFPPSPFLLISILEESGKVGKQSVLYARRGRVYPRLVLGLLGALGCSPSKASPVPLIFGSDLVAIVVGPWNWTLAT